MNWDQVRGRWKPLKGLVFVPLLWVGLAVCAVPATGCKQHETKKTTLKIETPDSERKVTIEKRVKKDHDDD